MIPTTITRYYSRHISTSFPMTKARTSIRTFLQSRLCVADLWSGHRIWAIRVLCFVGGWSIRLARTIFWFLILCWIFRWTIATGCRWCDDRHCQCLSNRTTFRRCSSLYKNPILLRMDQRGDWAESTKMPLLRTHLKTLNVFLFMLSNKVVDITA